MSDTNTFLAPSEPVAYRVTVDNIGLVLETYDESTARDTFDEYTRKSKAGEGRAAGERVYFFEDNTVTDEYDPDARDWRDKVHDFVNYECRVQRRIKRDEEQGREWLQYWNPIRSCTMIVEWTDSPHASGFDGQVITEIFLPTPDTYRATLEALMGDE